MPPPLPKSLLKPSAKEVEWEVLPPESRSKPRSSVETILRWLALIMDELLRVPGTRFRVGLDPIIGLIPGIGDTASAITSALVLFHAARNGVPKVLLARMAANILINELIGIIPGVGDAFSFWFKSNSRNYELLRRHQVAPRASRKSDWIFLCAIFGLLFIIVTTGLFVSFLLLQAIGKMIAGV